MARAWRPSHLDQRRQAPGGRGASASERHETGPAPTGGGLAARAWRPSHLDQRRHPVVDEAAATPAVEGRPRPRWSRSERQRASRDPARTHGWWSRGSGLAALAPRPTTTSPRWSSRRPQPPVVEERARASVTRPGTGAHDLREVLVGSGAPVEGDLVVGVDRHRIRRVVGPGVVVGAQQATRRRCRSVRPGRTAVCGGRDTTPAASRSPGRCSPGRGRASRRSGLRCSPAGPGPGAAPRPSRRGRRG